MMLPFKILARAALALSVLAYLLCFTQVGICVQGLCNEYRPRDLLAFGIFQFFDRETWVAGVTWLAIPVLFMAWVFLLRADYRWTFRFTICALAMALSLHLRPEVTVASEAGSQLVTSFGLGYWIWIASIVLAALSALLADPRVLLARFISSTPGTKRSERHWREAVLAINRRPTPDATRIQ
jgi:hypothetical protein